MGVGESNQKTEACNFEEADGGWRLQGIKPRERKRAKTVDVFSRAIQLAFFPSSVLRQPARMSERLGEKKSKNKSGE